MSDKYVIEILIKEDRAYVTLSDSGGFPISSGSGPKTTVLQLVKGAGFVLALRVNSQKQN